MVHGNQPGSVLIHCALVLAVHAAGIQSTLAQEIGNIRGVVYNTAGDLALDSKVRVVGMGLLTTVDDSARFSFADLPEGIHILEAVSARWGHDLAEVSIADGQTSEVILEVVVHVDLEEIVVSAGPVAMTRSSAVQPADALSHQELVEASEGTLGETLNDKVGITSTYLRTRCKQTNHSRRRRQQGEHITAGSLGC